MPKTPDEIKKGLEHCSKSKPCVDGCPYKDKADRFYTCQAELLADALALVQQLEAERDAAVSLIPHACAYCKWYGTKHGGFFPDCKNQSGCKNVSGINTGWEWRGVQKEV